MFTMAPSPVPTRGNELSESWRATGILSYFLFAILVTWVVFTFPLFYIVITFSVAFLYLGCFFLLAYLEKQPEHIPVLEKWPFVSIIIPAYNRGESLRMSLEHVMRLRETYPGKTEVIVVNDGSMDQTKEILNEFKGKITTIHFDKNKGKAHALNVAWKKAKGNLIAAMDGDSYPNPDTLNKLVPHFYRDTNVGAVTTIVRVNNRHGWLQKIQEVEYYLEFGLKNSVLHTLDSLYVTPGPFSMYAKKALEKIGGYDEYNITEDMEITFHLHQAGYRVILETNAQVYTDVPDTLNKLFRQRQRWSRGGWQTIFKYRKELFSKQKFFFRIFFPLRVILDTSAILFLALATRMGYEYAMDISRSLHAYTTISFETIVFPPLYLNSNLFLYLLIVGITVLMTFYGTHAAGARKRTLSIPGIILFLGVYWVFILSTQVYGLLLALSGGKNKW